MGSDRLYSQLPKPYSVYISLHVDEDIGEFDLKKGDGGPLFNIGFK